MVKSLRSHDHRVERLLEFFDLLESLERLALPFTINALNLLPYGAPLLKHILDIFYENEFIRVHFLRQLESIVI